MKILLVTAIVFLATLLTAACDNPARPDLLNSFDAVNYRVTGANITGLVIIDYSTPAAGVISVTTNLAVPFSSGTLNGFGQYSPSRPSISINILQSGCIEAQILVNAIVSREARGCGPTTITLVR